MNEESLFAAALDKADSAARAAFLAEACGTDAALRSRVEALLASHDRAGAFLEQPAVALPNPQHAATRAFNPDADQTSAHGEGHSEDTTDALGFLAPATRPDSLGRIGHYEVLEVLGRGGFGIVFRAFDDVLQRVVAVKMMAPQMAATSPARKRFLREARAGGQLQHENVVRIHGTEEQPLPYLVMEFIAGVSLQQRLDRTGPFDVPEVLRIGRQIAEGLAAAHANDLIHRDIKPANILIDGGPRQHVKITDFGLARAADDASISQSGIVAGTPMYMAPEQAKGETLDHRADLFSLGSVLYTMLTGRPPFRANSTVAVLKRVAEEAPRPMREIISEVPVWLCRIVEKLHAKDPAERYQSAREVADVLADCEQQLKQPGGLKDFSRIPGGKPRGRMPRWVKHAVGCLVVGVIIGAAVFAAIRFIRPGASPRATVDDGTTKSLVTPQSGIADPYHDAVLRMTFEPETFYQKDGKTYVRDLSGHGNDGLCDQVQFTPDGKSGGGLKCTSNGALRIDKSLFCKQSSYTITGWVRLSDDGRPNEELGWLCREIRSFNIEEPIYVIPLLRSGAVLTNALNKERPGWLNVFTEPLINPNGKWFFIAVTLEQGGSDSGNLSVCVDERVFTLKSQMVNMDGIFSVQLGAYMEGAIDEVSVFHRALASTEIDAIRRQGMAGKPLSPAGSESAGFVPLFNGKDLTGWKTHPDLPCDWRVENGALTSPTPGRSILFSTRDDFADFRLRAEVKVSERGGGYLSFRRPFKVNSGVGAIQWYAVALGNPNIGTKQAPRKNGSVLNSPEDSTDPGVPAGEWFTLEVEARGNHLQVFVNDTKTADYVDPDSRWPRGHIALAHNNQVASRVSFRKIEIKELPASPPPNVPVGLPPTYKNSIGMEFVKVPKGKSWLGGNKDNLGDQEVEIPADFYLGMFEVTQEEWEKVMGENPSRFSRMGEGKDAVKDISDADLKRFPVENVSWDQIQVFVAKLNKLEKDSGWVYRLPKAVEWEYACRGGPMADKVNSAFDYYFAEPTNTLKPQDANFNDGDGLKRTCKVGSYQPNALGLFDMHGNVWEWCDDGDGGGLRFMRGGSWDLQGLNCTAHIWRWFTTNTRFPFLGFRVVRVPSRAPAIEPSPMVAALREAVTAREKSLENIRTGYKNGGRSRRDVSAAEVDLIEARIRLAEAEGDHAAVIGQLEALVKLREEECALTATAVKAGKIAANEQNQADARLAEAKARLAKAQADAKGK